MRYKIARRTLDPRTPKGVFFLSREDEVSFGHDPKNLIVEKDEGEDIISRITDPNWFLFPWNPWNTVANQAI